MKKNFFFCIVFLPLLFVFAACSNKVMVFDDLLPEAETVTLYWSGAGSTVRPVSYNGIDVDWKVTGWGVAAIKIPGGNTTIGVEGQTSQGSTTWTWNGYSFTHNFEGGKEYSIHVTGGRITIRNGKSFSRGDIVVTFNPWSR
ncbi:MAG: hypothetical protein FWD14_00670 [Treponema sp.]|nr:hypothetical protein [Treponema sp.]